MKDGKIAVAEDEAERVRLIFRRYVELGSVNALVRDIRTKTRLYSTGLTRGGILFGRGTLFYLLRNRFYIGEVNYKGEILPGEQPAILGKELFDEVQQKLTDQWSHRNHAKSKSDHLLTGLLFDDAGRNPRHQSWTARSLLRLAAASQWRVQDSIGRIGLPNSGNRHRRHHCQIGE
jgi:site-specific DNA recombinase